MVSSGIGLDAAAFLGTQEIQSSKRRLPRLPKRLSYMLMGIWKLFRFVPVRGYLVLDGTKKIEFNHIYFVSVHIHPYEGGGFRFAPKANGSDGMLEVCVVHNSSRMGVLAAVADAFWGRAGRRRGVRYYGCREIWIHVDVPMQVHADEENCYSQTDIHLRCIEKKIQMIL